MVTPVPMDLPVKASETATLAELIFQNAEGKPVNDDLRNRLAGRAGVSPLTTVKPYFGSLVRDPSHPSTYYLAVDGRDSQSLLLHIALASAPTSGIFPNPLLIGRMRAAGREIVVNSIPFSTKDWDSLDRYAHAARSAFLPRPQGAQAGDRSGQPASGNQPAGGVRSVSHNSQEHRRQHGVHGSAFGDARDDYR